MMPRTVVDDSFLAGQAAALAQCISDLADVLVLHDPPSPDDLHRLLDQWHDVDAGISIDRVAHHIQKENAA